MQTLSVLCFKEHIGLKMPSINTEGNPRCTSSCTELPGPKFCCYFTCIHEKTGFVLHLRTYSRPDVSLILMYFSVVCNIHVYFMLDITLLCVVVISFY